MGYAEGSTTPQGRDRRDAILDAAMVEFSMLGYDNAALSKIAGRAGISKSGLLHHFVDKPTLLDAVLSERTFVYRHPDRVRPTSGVLDTFALNAEVNESDEDWARLHSIMVAESLKKDHPAFDRMHHRYEDLIASRTAELEAEYPGLSAEDAADIAALAVAVLDGLEIQLALLGRRNMGRAFRLFASMADRAISDGLPT